jgi:hypothetical protein
MVKYTKIFSFLKYITPESIFIKIENLEALENHWDKVYKNTVTFGQFDKY